MEKNIFTHVGARPFDISMFEPVENPKFGAKPINGGYWASLESSPYGFGEVFKDVTKSAQYVFKFTIKIESRILKLEKNEDLINLPRYKKDYSNTDFPIILDFEKLSKEYDAIWCVAHKGSELYGLLVGWDCDSILILNKEIIEPISDEKKSN